MNGKEKQVCDYLEEKRDDIIRLLQDLVSKESVNPPGDTRGAAQVILDKLGEYRIPCQEIVSNEVHKSLLATIGEGKQNLLFNAHIDTVPVGDLQKWTTAPFNEPLHGNIMYGRGCADDKGGVAAMVMAMCALRRCGIDLKGRMTVNPVADEETGGENGAKYLLENGYLKPDMVVVGEITTNEVAIVHKGLVWFKITSKGKTAHASTPWDGVNAISKMVGFLHKVEQYYKEELPRHIDPLTPPATYNIGTIEGGPKVNVVSDICTVMLDRRMLAEESLEFVENELQKLLDEYKAEDPEADITFECVNYSPSLRTSPDEELVKKSLAVVSEFGRNDQPVGYKQSSDGRYFSVRGIPTVLIGPGVASVGHTPDENIDVREVVECAKIYAVLAMRLLGYKE
ncbi:M20 family metallopeptidase [Anaerotruncus rubiinfantis]|uniref:M20 family metallopeptidase n=1 Tax=Anaerotruncus rubiinfantis TaxID=1720200 RepID=UPI0034A54224